jgi:hypothetical protein
MNNFDYNYVKKRFSIRKIIQNESSVIYLAIGLLIMLIYHPWFSNSMIARGDWKALSSTWMLDYTSWPSVWNDSDFGGISFLYLGRLSRFLLWHLQGIIHQQCNLGFEWTEKIIWFFPFLFFSVLSMYLLVKMLFNDQIITAFAILFFLTNNFIVFRMHGAQLTLGMAYALTPLALYFFIKALQKEKLKSQLNNILLNGFILSIISYYDYRTVPLVLFLQLICGSYFLWFLNKSIRLTFFKLVSYFTIIGIFLILSNFFWIFPTVLNLSASLDQSSSFFSIQILRSLSRTNLYHALGLSIGSNAGGDYIYGIDQINSGLISILIIIIYGFSLLYKPRKLTIVWLLLSLMFAFLAKGVNSPFANINYLLYKYIPLFSMYRLPSKFLLIGGAVPISILFAVGSRSILHCFSNIVIKKTFMVVLILLPFLVIMPSLIGHNSLKNHKGGSSFKPFVSDKYFIMEKWLGERPSGFKSAFFPGAPSYYFFSSEYPRYEPLSQMQKQSTVGSFYHHKFRTLSEIKKDNYDYTIADLLRFLNVKYVFIAPEDDTMWYWHPKSARDEYFFMLEASKGINKAEFNSIYLVDNPLPNLYINSNIIFIDGNLHVIFDYLRNKNIDLQKVSFVDKHYNHSFDIDNSIIAISLAEAKKEKNVFTSHVWLPAKSNYQLCLSVPEAAKVKYFVINGQKVANSSVDNDFVTIPKEMTVKGKNTIQLVVLSEKYIEDLINGHIILTYDNFIIKSHFDTEVIIKKDSASKYHINIVNPPDRKFYLNFLESYDSDWEINQKLVPDVSAQGTNIFEINNESLSRNSQIKLTLEHKRQKYLDVGFKITLLFGIVIGLVFIANCLNWIIHKKCRNSVIKQNKKISK